MTTALRCPSIEEIIGYLEADAQECDEVEAHLWRCERCAGILAEAASWLHDAQEVSGGKVPQPLCEEVLSRYGRTESPLHGVVLRLVGHGLEVVRSFGEGLSVSCLSEPILVGVRGGGDPAARRVAVSLVGCQGEATAEVDHLSGDQVRVTIRLKVDGMPAIRERILVKVSGLVVFSDCTDETGRLLIPPLSAGRYKIVCPSLNLEFVLDIDEGAEKA